jgi:hypothetical protein
VGTVVLDGALHPVVGFLIRLVEADAKLDLGVSRLLPLHGRRGHAVPAVEVGQARDIRFGNADDEGGLADNRPLQGVGDERKRQQVVARSVEGGRPGTGR